MIGAGISGLTAALLLKQLKCNVTVFEKNKYISKEGAGIQITSNGSFVLKKLGLEKPVIRVGIKPNNLCLFDEDDFKCIGSLEILETLKGRYGRSFITLNRYRLNLVQEHSL
ncbi:NAD(P)-binding protein [Paracoccaceae bacterium]|nr:NAD(P)-binding protein [Paracoccaceae bacterium]